MLKIISFLFKKYLSLQLEKDRCRVLLVGQVTTLSLSKQGFESPTRYTKKIKSAI